jgi:hypothetical protein
MITTQGDNCNLLGGQQSGEHDEQIINKASNFPNIIILNTYKHLDRIQISTLDYNFRVLSRLMEIYKHDRIRLLHRFFQDGITKISYIKYPVEKNPFSTIVVHDVTYEDQLFLIDLLRGVYYWLSQIEFALDIFSNIHHFDLINFLFGGVVLRYSRAGSFRVVNTTLYLGKGGIVHAGVKGIRLYPKSGFVRLEFQLNRRGIKDRKLTLPVAPDAIDIFEFIDYRLPCRTDRVAARMAKKKKEHYRHRRYRGRIDKYKLYQEVLRTYIDYLLDQPNTKTPYDWRPAVAGQIDNFKEEFSDLADRVDYFFPKWEGRREEILALIGRG